MAERGSDACAPVSLQRNSRLHLLEPKLRNKRSLPLPIRDQYHPRQHFAGEVPILGHAVAGETAKRQEEQVTAFDPNRFDLLNPSQPKPTCPPQLCGHGRFTRQPGDIRDRATDVRVGQLNDAKALRAQNGAGVLRLCVIHTAYLRVRLNNMGSLGGGGDWVSGS